MERLFQYGNLILYLDSEESGTDCRVRHVNADNLPPLRTTFISRHYVSNTVRALNLARVIHVDCTVGQYSHTLSCLGQSLYKPFC